MSKLLAAIAASVSLCLAACSTIHGQTPPAAAHGAKAPIAQLRRVQAAGQKPRLQRVTSTGPMAHQMQWHWANPLPSGDEFYAIALGLTGYVAVGDDGTLYTSPDTVNWTAQASGIGSGGNLLDVIYTGSRYVAAGLVADRTGSVFVQSSDGITWIPAGSLSGVDVDHLAYGNGIYVATNQVAATSTDLKTWTTHAIRCSPSPTCTDLWFAPVFGANRFVALATDGDGVTHLSSSVDAPELGACQHHAVCGCAAGQCDLERLHVQCYWHRQRL